MEEKKLSPEQSEEVIELLDIVAESASEENSAQEEKPAFSDEAEETKSPEEMNVATSGDGSESGEEVLLSEESIEPRPHAVNEVVMKEEFPEKDVCGSLGADHEKACDISMNTAAEESRCTAEGVQELVLRESLEKEVKTLEQRVEQLEKTCRELAESVESLSQQIAQAGTMFLEDASVRLNMEELVSRMLDARLPSSSDQDENGESDPEARLEALEKRVGEWEEKSEQMAASAAARVIRDEIAAMRAGAGTSC